MNAISCCSFHSAVPAWVTVFEAANIINQQLGVSVTTSDVWRYALYGHLTLSIYPCINTTSCGGGQQQVLALSYCLWI